MRLPAVATLLASLALVGCGAGQEKKKPDASPVPKIGSLPTSTDGGSTLGQGEPKTPVTTEPSNKADPKAEKAIAEIKKSGGGVGFEEDPSLGGKSGEPVGFIDLISSKLTDKDLAILKDIPRIASLRLGRNQVTENGLDVLRALPSLKELELSNSEAPPECWQKLKALKGLTVLTVQRCVFDDRHMALMKNFRDLTSLTLSGCQVNEGLSNLKGLKKLSRLYISYSPVTDKALASIGDIMSLNALTLMYTNVTDKGLLVLKGLKQLRELSLSGEISDAGLDNLTGLNALETLTLLDTKVTAEGKARLKKSLPKLTILGS
jgi:hypothetical protein